MKTASLTTEIGSLPFHNVDAAISHAFQVSIPFLPQIPVRHPSEFMVHQALDGIPGLHLEAGGFVTLQLDAWNNGAHKLNTALESAFEPGRGAHAFEAFQPMPGSWSCWKPFVWEIQERETPVAKAQIAGPLTCQWVLRPVSSGMQIPADAQSQILRFILARSLAMIDKIKAAGAKPLFFFDEPGLSIFNRGNPAHIVALQDLKLAVQALKARGAEVGVHCCSNTDWESLLGIGLDWLSIDARLSLSSLLAQDLALGRFLAGGGRLSLGVIPTDLSPGDTQAFDPARTARELKGKLPAIALSSVLFTPACGLALLDAEQAEWTLHALHAFAKHWAPLNAS